MCRTGGFSCYKPSKVCKLVVSSVALHNICVTNSIPITEQDQHFRDQVVIPNLEIGDGGVPQNTINASVNRDNIAATL